MTPQFRNATAAELATILNWAAAEGWNPGLDDARAFYATDPQGFFVADLGEGPVAAISVVNHTDDIAFLGLYLCLPDHRGEGIGFGLWQHALPHAGDRVVGLDGVPDQQDNYRKSGFVATGETYRFEGDIPANTAAPIRRASPADAQALIDLDAAATGYAKPAFLDHWLANTPDRETFVLAEGEGVQGFATIRRCRLGAKIGPFTARDMATAEALLTGLAARWPDRPLILDVPGDQKDLTAFCQSMGMTAVFNTARMYRGSAPTPGPFITGAGTLELG